MVIPLSGVSICTPSSAAGAARSLPAVHDVPCPHPRPVDDPLSAVSLVARDAALPAPELQPQDRLAASAATASQAKGTPLGVSLLRRVIGKPPPPQWAAIRQKDHLASAILPGRKNSVCLHHHTFALRSQFGGCDAARRRSTKELLSVQTESP